MQNSQGNTCQSLFLNRIAGESAITLLKKETPVWVFSCEYCRILKNAFFTEHFWWLFLGEKKLAVYSRQNKSREINELDECVNTALILKSQFQFFIFC